MDGNCLKKLGGLYFKELLERIRDIQASEKAQTEYKNIRKKLIGSWKINYVDNKDFCIIQGEWHFSWVLEGMAIQDVIILPDYEYGTSLRIYNPDTYEHNRDSYPIITAHRK